MQNSTQISNPKLFCLQKDYSNPIVNKTDCTTSTFEKITIKIFTIFSLDKKVYTTFNLS